MVLKMYKEIERSIVKTYRKEIWARFIKAVKEFELVKEKDKIAVCISGGKDSFLLAKCMQELKRHGKIDFEVVFICMNPGYNEKNLELIKSNAEKMNIDLHIFNSNIFDIVDTFIIIVFIFFIIKKIIFCFTFDFVSLPKQ